MGTAKRQPPFLYAEQRAAVCFVFLDLFFKALDRDIVMLCKAFYAHEFLCTAIDKLAMQTDVIARKLCAASDARLLIQSLDHIFTNLALNSLKE